MIKKTAKIGLFLLVILLIQSNNVLSQYVIKRDAEVYYLFAERKVFYPDFNFCNNSSVALQSYLDKNGEYRIDIVINNKRASIFNTSMKYRGNKIELIFRDNEGYAAKMVIKLLSSQKMEMYFNPIKTETEEIFVRHFNQPYSVAYSWYEPTLNGFINHPESPTYEGALKKYYTMELGRSFIDDIENGKKIFDEMYKQYRKREKEQEERIRRENTMFVTIDAYEKGKGCEISLNGKTCVDSWQDSLLIGDYTVTCRRKHHKTLTQRIQVTKSKQHFILYKMEPYTMSYTFNSCASEVGATVRLNDSVIGNTPVNAEIRLIEPNKIEYSNNGYNTQLFYLTTDSTNVNVSDDTYKKSNKMTGVLDVSPTSLTVKMGKNRSGGIDPEGNFYIYLGGGITSWTSYCYGLNLSYVSSMFNLDLLLYNHKEMLFGIPLGDNFLQTGARLGLIMKKRNNRRITAQIGTDYNGAYGGGSFTLGLKIERSLFKWATLSITPEAICDTEFEDWSFALRLNFSIFNRPNQKLPKKR